MSRPNPRHSYAWTKQSRARLSIAAANDEPCCRCGQPINYQADGRTRMGPTCDHLDPIGQGGHHIPPLDRLAPAHRSCNSRHGQTISTANNNERKRRAAAASFSKRAAFSTPAVGNPSPTPGKGTVGLPYAAGWLGEPPDSYAPPRLETPVPDVVVGSLAGEALPVMERRLGGPLRWWQRYATTRLLEVDESGRLVWDFCLDSTPRQVGKSWWIREISLWRASQAERFGEPQSVLHIAKDLGLARRIMSSAWRWAVTKDLEARKSNGQEAVMWPDGESGWMIRSQDAAYGWTGSAAHVDEAWAILPEVVWEGLWPTLVERDQPQLVLHSTAHRRATALVPSVLPRWLAGEGLVLLWGADPEADHDDPAVWRAASPHWSDGRLRAMTVGRDEPGFVQQWLNVWPELGAGQGWLPAGQWDGLAVPAMPEGVPVVAVESSMDGSGLAVARCVAVDGRATVEAVHVDSMQDMRTVVARWRSAAGEVVAGKSLMGFMDPSWSARPVTQADYAAATAQFVDAVRGGQLGHLTGQELDEQIPAMTLKGVGSGAVLTGNGVHVGRCAVWAVWAALSRKPDVWIV